MRKIYLLFTIYYLLFATPALAKPTATPTGRAEQIKERVEERINQIKEKVKKRALWGTLTQITNSTLVLTTPRGEQRVKTTSETKYLLGKKEVKFADLAIGNFIIAMGYEESGVLVAQRIAASAKPPAPAPRRQAVYGRVSDISEEEKILVLTHPKKPGVSFEVKTTDKTLITKKVGGPPTGEAGKIKKVDFTAIKIGDRVVAVGTQEKENGTLTAKLIRVIPASPSASQGGPGKATGLEKESTTPTPKAKVKATPTP